MSSTATSRPPRVLVIEDNSLLAGLVCDTLRECGIEPVGPVPGVDQAARLLKEKGIDGAVVDINLRGASCYPLCAHFREWKIPFLFVSGSDQAEVPDAFRDVPFLPKPFDAALLCREITSLFGKRGNLKESKPQ